MSTSTTWRRRRVSRVEAIAFAATIGAIVIYLGVLHLLDGRAERYFESLRQSHPDQYLTQLRERRGFDAYLPEYRAMEGFDTYIPATPTFLVGRWTMQTATLRLTPGSSPGECTNPVTFDYGLLLLRDALGVSLPVTYRIENNTVELKSKGFGVLPVKLVSYGAELDHIEFVPPGKKDKVYAYRCGR